MQTLSTFVRAYNDDVLLEATFCYDLVYVSVAMCAREDEDVVGRTRDQRRACGAIGRRDGLSLCVHVSIIVRYTAPRSCTMAV
jgi:hypothetical protein